MRVKALKSISLVVAIVCFVAVSPAANYYVSYKTGSDANPGTQAQPWKTIAKVNAMMDQFNAGDSILFKRGEIWETTNSNLTIKAPRMVEFAGPSYLTFGAYGTGAKPVLWSAAASGAKDPIFCNTDGMSYIHLDNLHVYSRKTGLSNPCAILVYSPSPTKWKKNWWLSNITVSDSDMTGICLANIDTYLIENCDLYNTRQKPLLIGGTATYSIKNGTVRNCRLHHSTEEASIALHALVWPPSETPHPGPNHLIEDCEIYGAPDTQGGLDIQAEYVTFRRCYFHDNANQSVSTGGGTHHITFDSCYFKESVAAIACQGHAAYGTTDNITIKNCIFNLSGTAFAIGICGSNYEIYNNTFYLSHPTGIPKIADFHATYSSFAIKFKNNIVYERTNATVPYVVRFLNSAQNPADIGISWDYNWYYFPNGMPRFYVAKDGTSYSYVSAPSWKTTWSADAHSSYDTMTDPRLENASGYWSQETDFRLKSDSPCRSAGVWVGITTDYFGNKVNNPPDIGACAYTYVPGLIASASASPDSGQAPLTVNFAGSATGGTPPYRYQWNFGDGQSSSSQNPSHVYNSAGTFTATITVTDSQEATSSDSINITATSTVPPLIAAATATPYSGKAPLAVSFSGSAAGGTPPYSYNWNFGDGKSSSSQNPSHSYDSVGTYIAILTATDSRALKDDTSLTITVTNTWTTTYELAISSATGSPAPGQGGTTDPPPGVHTYSAGSSVLVKSIWNENYRFSRWKGETETSNPFFSPITVLLDRAKSLSANFCTKCGDVTGDLTISPADAQKTFDIFLQKIPNPTECELENGDVNCSGTATEPKITPADAQAIFNKYLKKGELPGDCSGASRPTAATAQLQTSPSEQVYLTIQDMTASPEQDLVVPIIVESSSSIRAFGLDLSFPSESLAFIGIEQTNFSGDFDQIGANEIMNGILRVGGYTLRTVSGGSTRVLVTLVFRVIDETVTSSSLFISNTFDDLRHAQVRNGIVHQKSEARSQRLAQRLPGRKSGAKRYDF